MKKGNMPKKLFDCTSLDTPKDIQLYRIKNYDKDYCWQYDIRLNNLSDDVKQLPDGFDYTTLTVHDFEFKPICDDVERHRAILFIRRHEWLGDVALNTTHYFGAYYKDILAGVVTMGNPTAYSNMLGSDTKDIERLISRGACISWSPKCLGSAFVSWCIKWMVKNTQYRIFSAYSDPAAKELGTIYQSLNFYYLGNNFGASAKYISPYSGKLISDRTFRSRSYYKRYANDLGITWDSSWSKGDKVIFENIPDDIELRLREYSRKMRNQSEKIDIPPKHKYVYVLGASKLETKRLRKKFESMNKLYPYPKNRGE
jgi:hypothetical protein